jgi:NAD(P)-dependent dehydrogenase (short-subunit alcohol dehydrogenase family)
MTPAGSTRMADTDSTHSTELRGMTALVTGGTTGIGRATARALVESGVRVLIFGRNPADLDSALEALGGEGAGAYGMEADVSQVDEVRRVFEEADRRLGQLDILVNNAALADEGIEEASLERIDYIVRTNVVGYLACAQEAVSRMKGRGGSIVLIGSMSADLREPDGSTYVATKGAVQAMAESLRKTVNEDGIRVTLIEPGKVATDMVDDSDEEKERKIAQGEMLRPEDIAAAVLWTLRQPARCDVVQLQIRPHGQVI